MPHVPDTVPGKRVTDAGARTEGRGQPSNIRGGSRMQESCTYGSVRGAPSNGRPYRHRQEKWSMPSSSDQTRVGRTLTLGGGAESSLEGRDIELSVSPKDIRTSPYDLCANRSDRRQSREGDCET